MHQSIHGIKEKCNAASCSAQAAPQESEWEAAPNGSSGPNPQLLLRQRQQVCACVSCVCMCMTVDVGIVRLHR